MKVLLLLGVVALFGGAAAQTLMPDDFARGFNVDPAADPPVQALDLPLEVYRLVQQPALADLRVFDAQGLEVAHTMLNVTRPAQAPWRVAVPFFRLGDTPLATVPTDLELRFSQPFGTTLELHSSEPGILGERGSFLLDTRALGGSVAGLSLGWGKRGRSSPRSWSKRVLTWNVGAMRRWLRRPDSPTARAPRSCYRKQWRLTCA